MSQPTSSGKLVLVLEDEALIALNLQEELQEAGYQVAGPFSTCEATLEWLASNNPDVAILDTVVRDGLCREIALELDRRAVPFLIYSGHQESTNLFSEFSHVTWIEKPAPPLALIEGCQQLLAA